MNGKTLVGTFVFAVLAGAGWTAASGADEKTPRRPNILWITCEDMSPNLGCFGDRFAVTPHLDRLAAEGVRYTDAFSTAGVCAPARSTIIMGVYPPAIGTHHMRCTGTLPEYVKCFPEYLRGAGYYCTNNNKEDYNFRTPKTAWDESSRKAHWRHRKPGQPFFAVFNLLVTHESQIRVPDKQYLKNTSRLTADQRHDPAKTPVPPYHPDASEVRKDWARYYDNITAMDYQAGDLLAELEREGLAEETIVFFYSDHGAGMPRSKRWLYDSSLHVPLIVRFPRKFQHLAPGKPGTGVDRLVSFVDLGPTVLSLAGVKMPPHVHGKPFLGGQAVEPRAYVFGHRDRMDERYDMCRAVRDKRYLYIRNYMPHLPWFHNQHIDYLYQMPTMQVWQRLADEGSLSGPSAVFMAKTKPAEELYDCQADPHNVRNLAGSAEHREVLRRLRQVHEQWMTEIVDLGLLSEAELHSRFGGKPPFDAVRRDPRLYPQARLLEAAKVAGRMDPGSLAKLVELLSDEDSAARSWGATGLLALGEQAGPAAGDLSKALRDPAPSVRVVAAEALCRLGQHDKALPVLADALKNENPWVRLAAANVLDRLGERARGALPNLEQAAGDSNDYVLRVLDHALSKLKQ